MSSIIPKAVNNKPLISESAALGFLSRLHSTSRIPEATDAIHSATSHRGCKRRFADLISKIDVPIKSETTSNEDLRDGLGIYYIDKVSYFQKWHQGELIESKKYSGASVDGLPHGWGTLFENVGGGMYQGDFDEGKKHGFGIDLLSNQQGVYFGLFHQDQRHGQGMFLFPLGTYDGQWELGKRKGFGKFLKEDLSLTFTGQWEDDLAQGSGILTFKDGRKFEGQWDKGWLVGSQLSINIYGQIKSS